MKKNTTLTACLLLAASLSLKAQIISTVAGNGTAGYSGSGTPATSAELYTPDCVAFDKAGNFYISDEQNDVVREVSISTGDITTVAGTPGSSSYTGNGGQATNATLYWPNGLAVDDSGNIYIGDTRNFVIRKVNGVTGIINTIGGNGTSGFSGDGGPATAAEISQIRYLALDDSGNIYFADANNNRIREIRKSTGIITTYAGNGTAAFSGDGGPATAAEINAPYGVTLDKAGNMYIADQDNNRIRMINVSTHIITTVAGNGTAGYSGDGGAATAAEVYNPTDVSIGPGGNLLIADTYNQVVRKVTISTGDISTIAGNGTAGYSGDGGAATAAEMHYPNGITLDAKGNLYIPDWANNVIRMVTNADPQGINEVSDNSSVRVYPNPSNGIFILQADSQWLLASSRLEVYNVLGEKVYSNTFSTLHSQFSIDLSGQPAGIYILKVLAEDGQSIIQKLEVSR